MDILDWVRSRKKISRLNAGVPVIVYQMGKVGSQSVYNSLKNEQVKPLYQIHSIRHDLQDPFLRKLFSYINIERKQANFISLVRDPVARNISSFFQNIELFTGCKYRPENLGADKLIELFLDKFHHTFPLTWFDAEMRTVTGINVYDHTFPESGIACIRHDPFDLLLIKSEADDSVKEKAIMDFTGLKTLQLVRTNITRDRTYAEAYSNFKKKIFFSEKYLDEMYDSKYARHFYSDDEINGFKAKWKAKPAS